MIEFENLFRDPINGSPSLKAGWVKLQEHAQTCMFQDILARTIRHEMTRLFIEGQPDLLAVNKYIGFRLVSDFKATGIHAKSSLAGLLDMLEGNELIDDQRLIKLRWNVHTKMMGREFTLPFQAVINDDVQLFIDIPKDMANAALAEKTRMAAAAMTANAAVNVLDPCSNALDTSAMWSTAHQNLGLIPLTGVNKASALALRNLYMFIANQKDPQVDAQSNLQGRPLAYRGKYVVTPMGLMESWVKALVEAEAVENAAGNMVANPIFKLGLEQVTNPYMTGSNYFMFADPKTCPQPALVFADLKNYATSGGGAQPVMTVSTAARKLLSGGQFGQGTEDEHFDTKYGVLLFSNLNQQLWYSTAAYWTECNAAPTPDEDESGS